MLCTSSGGCEPALEGLQLRFLLGRRVRDLDKCIGACLRPVDERLRRGQVLIDGFLERRLAALNARRGVDQLGGNSIRNRCGSRRVSVLGRDIEEGAVPRRVHLHAVRERAGRQRRAELASGGLENWARFRDDGVRCRTGSARRGAGCNPGLRQRAPGQRSASCAPRTPAAGGCSRGSRQHRQARRL